MSKLQMKVVLTLTFLGIAFYFLYPSWEWYGLPQAEREQREKLKDKIIGKVLNLGLDLRGGVHLVLELDADKLEKGVDVVDAVNRAIEIIRNRVDQFGVAEPLMTRQGDRWIVVQLPGIKDPERAKDLIGKTALLEFRLVDTSPVLSQIAEKLREKGVRIEEINAYPEIVKMIPQGFEVFPGREDRYYLLKSSAELTGAYLTNAKVEMGGEYGYPHVAIEFNSDGSKIFSRVTEANINRSLAIVLDGVVQSAPNIESKIPDGKGIIRGNFTMDDAKFLATVLRAGALPAPVRIIEERTVGPTLGEDSIKAGVSASAFGLLLILIFMGIYYRFSGMVANFALVLNFVLLLGLMAAFHFTLTLPGIAGIILSLAMAVDANVLILERMREEFHAGKTQRMAIDAAYQKAFVTILDSNLTTLIAAVFLFQFGTGPIKGFAVTLTFGIIISMFTAIMVTKTIYELLFQEKIITQIKL
ncbi:MAG: protein translocase subunit SecD [Elusimicrobiota bacterium]